jgi:hypothetical protein
MSLITNKKSPAELALERAREKADQLGMVATPADWALISIAESLLRIPEKR